MDFGILGAIVSVGGLGLIFGGGLAYASKLFYVYVDPRVEEVDEELPGANCGACGLAGCRQMALAVVEGKLTAAECPVANDEARAKVAAIMGTDAVTAEEMVAVVYCQGSPDHCVERFDYQGVKSCTAAELVGGGFKACTYGCLGLGECVDACQFDAMLMGEDKLPKVIEANCTGCGKCVEACPRGIMAMIPKNAYIYNACVNQDRGKTVKNVCDIGCTGCTLCANPKTTPSGMITMNKETNLPIFHYSIEDDSVLSVFKCPPRSIIDKLNRPEPPKPPKPEKKEKPVVEKQE
ncbi:MAG: RnfABCDGE type electron transport complex subunit B [Candidatus Electryonea clarkiae]|nr:RnfABCDGE type electron transport complex subunit B [Candidatus Electryonea clarkiae]MDP8288165.1 RnfABCDGE type electron transport complex subunit B [Candidatus Electryonea clarkiae]